MTLERWWFFVGVAFLLCGTPGPNMLHIMARSVELGFRRSIPAMAGCLAAIGAALAASAAGLSALLIAVPAAFELLRYAGAAYLLYLGIKAWRAPVAPADIVDQPVAARGAWELMRGGFLVGISNPKLILFAAAFLPQFVSPNAPQVPQFAILVATFIALETFWYCVYALGGRSIARLLTRPALKRGFNRLTGIIFIAFGIGLLTARIA